MTDRASPVTLAAELRLAFDRSFAEAPLPRAASLEDVLEITIGGARYALRTTELSGLLADVAITPVPTTVPELLGLCVVRGSVLPVYDLRAMLGHRSDAAPRWIATTSTPVLGLAFDALDGHRRVSRSAFVPAHRGDDSAPYVREIVQLETIARLIVSVASIVEAINSRVRGHGPWKE